MGADTTWDRLVALVPPPSQSAVGRKMEARTGTMIHVKSIIAQEALSRSMTKLQQRKLDAKFSQPKVTAAQLDLERGQKRASVTKGPGVVWCSILNWGTLQARDSQADGLPPLPGQKKEYDVQSQYKIVNGRMLGEPEEDEYVRQERSQITAWRLGTFYTWGGRLRHRQPTPRPLSEFYDSHAPGKILPLRL